MANELSKFISAITLISAEGEELLVKSNTDNLGYILFELRGEEFSFHYDDIEIVIDAIKTIGREIKS